MPARALAPDAPRSVPLAAVRSGLWPLAALLALLSPIYGVFARALAIVVLAVAVGVFAYGRWWRRTETSFSRALRVGAAAYAGMLAWLALTLLLIAASRVDDPRTLVATFAVEGLAAAGLAAWWVRRDARAFDGPPERWPAELRVDLRRGVADLSRHADGAAWWLWPALGLALNAPLLLRALGGGAIGPALLVALPVLAFVVSVPALARTWNVARHVGRLERARGVRLRIASLPRTPA